MVRISGIAGGLPVPPPQLTWLVAGHYDVVKSLRNGRRTSEHIRETLARAGLRLEDFGEILDFGCGSGRVLRNWKSLKTTRTRSAGASDICDSLSSSETTRIRRCAGPTRHSRSCMCARSSRTWRNRSSTRGMRELRRILKPEGHLLFTTHGEMYLKSLSDAERKTSLTGQLVVRNGELSGRNECGVYHPADYVKAHLTLVQLKRQRQPVSA